MNKAIFLDRDGTINVEKHYIYKIEDFEFLPGVLDGMKLLCEAGFVLVIITNQSGIARGYYTEADFHKLNNWMIETLKKQGVEIAKVYYCPHHPDAQIEDYRMDCECRKPKIGMFEQAVKELDIDLSQSFVIGDKMRDCMICLHTLCRGYMIIDPNSISELNIVREMNHKRITFAKNMLECVRDILLKSDTKLIRI